MWQLISATKSVLGSYELVLASYEPKSRCRRARIRLIWRDTIILKSPSNYWEPERWWTTKMWNNSREGSIDRINIQDHQTFYSPLRNSLTMSQVRTAHLLIKHTGRWVRNEIHGLIDFEWIGWPIRFVVGVIISHWRWISLLQYCVALSLSIQPQPGQPKNGETNYA